LLAGNIITGYTRATKGYFNMDATSPQIGARHPMAQSRVSNGAELLPGIDGRSQPARRYRDLLGELAAPFGGLGAMPETLRQIARRAALLMLNSENIEAAACRGEVIDPIAHATLSNALNRLLGRLERARPVAESGDALNAHLAKLARSTTEAC
jgi:hypothetical protein